MADDNMILLDSKPKISMVDHEVSEMKKKYKGDIHQTLQSDAFKVYVKNNGDEAGNEGASHMMEKTNAYGQMVFVGPDRRTRAEYIRLSDQTDINQVGVLMTDIMSLKEWPKILISVVGGLNSFEISKELKKSLQKDLLKVCIKVAGMKKETWFITNALDIGATRMIAEAVEGYKYHDTNVIGITPWGVVAHNEVLLQHPKNVNLPKYPIVKDLHKVSKKVKAQSYFLNKDHTHFFLVDTGKDGFTRKEIEFRSNLEKFIVDRQIAALQKKSEREDHHEPAGKNSFIPAVQLVINGGFKSLQHINSTLFPNGDKRVEPIMPVIVVAGSGRVANWITSACKIQDSRISAPKTLQTHTNNLKNLLPLQQEIKLCYPEKYDEVYQLVLKISKDRRDYIILYEQGDCLDEKILWSFLQARNKPEERELTLEQYKMVMLWERPDIAEKALISESGNSMGRIDYILKELLMKALKKQNIQFIDLIFQLGFDMSNVNHHFLEGLYAKVLEETYRTKKNGLQAFIPKKYFGIEAIVMQSEQASTPTMERSPSVKPCATEMMSEISKSINKLTSIKLVDYKNDTAVVDPFKDLFLWAVMCNKQETAISLWKRGENPLAKALVARRMYLRIAKKYLRSPNFDDHVYKSFHANAKHFETLAYELLERCSEVAIPSTKVLIKYKISNWGNRTIVELASLSGFQQFISHPRCKDIMDDRWRGSIAMSDGEFLNLKIVAGIFFFPLIFKWLKFRESYRHTGKKCCKKNPEDESEPKWYQKCIWNNSTCTIRACYDKIVAFLSSPVTKFWTNSMTYVIFLTLFSFVMVNELNDHPKYLEFALLAFIVSFLFEEIRQIFREYGISKKQKLRNWWHYHWNKLDCAAINIFVVAFILRIIPSEYTLPYYRFLYAVDFFLWALKLLQLFSLNRKIGIYVVMLERMLADVIYFVVIILVLVLAFSVPRFALLYPNNKIDFYGKTMEEFSRHVFMVPTFQLFGELFIEKPESTEDNFTVFGTPLYDESRQSESFVMWLTFVYMVLANLLLINLLIAVFNNTYTIVQSNASKIWHCQNYHFVLEYEKRSFLPPPFSIISHIKVFVLYLMQSRQKKMFENVNQNRVLQDLPIQQYFEQFTDLYQLVQFENECLANYLHAGQSREERLQTDIGASQQTEIKLADQRKRRNTYFEQTTLEK